MSRLRSRRRTRSRIDLAASFNHRVLGSRVVAHRRGPRQFDGRSGDHPADGGAGRGSSHRRRVDLHGRWISRAVHRARRLPCRRDLARHQSRRSHQHRVMGGNRTGLVQPDVPLVVPHRGRIGHGFHDPRRRRGERGRAELDRRVHRSNSPAKALPPASTASAPRPQRVSTSSRWAPRSLPWKPSSPTSSRPRRAPRRRAPQQSRPRRQAPCPQAPNRWGPHRAMLRWQPRRASSRLAPTCRSVDWFAPGRTAPMQSRAPPRMRGPNAAGEALPAAPERHRRACSGNRVLRQSGGGSHDRAGLSVWVGPR